MVQFLKTTLIGGILFLVPIIIFIAVIGKALELTLLPVLRTLKSLGKGSSEQLRIFKEGTVTGGGIK
jgi:uncharacterized membrane protein